MRYVIGIIAILIGFVIIWKAEWFLTQFGRIPWAEEHLGADGGTRLFYKLLGLAIIFIAFLYMSGAAEGIILRIFAPTLRTGQ
ncbi:hypothetical protein HY478_01345 [Candidatus Uhrbacteria bacterium]|nr:hypothetical protein [Candidatus Uhrbacteria bacterium]